MRLATRCMSALTPAFIFSVLPTDTLRAAPAPGYFIPPAASRQSPPPSSRGPVPPEGSGKSGQASGTEYYVTAPSLAMSPRVTTEAPHIGPFSLEQSDSSPVPGENGRTVTLAYPVKSVPGMDLVINTFAGHRETKTGSSTGSAAVTAGVRFHW